MSDNQAIFYSSANSPLFKNTNINFALTSRYGGKSLQPYDSLNLAYHVGDKISHVHKNRKIIQNIFHSDKKLLWIDQIHSDIILDIEKKDYKHGFVGTADAMICANENVTCMVMIADCNPILIYDQNIRCFGLIHAGREGLVKSIIPKTIDKMIQTYGATTKNMLVFVGASIRKCCYEVSENLAMSFKKSYIIKDNSKYRLDLIALLNDQLTQSNISSKNIEVLPICSCCEMDLFSYRRDHTTGRFGLLATLV
ncbi:peptidoglycan editing factor PgeF [Helicobacter cappadocius]|uniref:Purine nucleoside phosphorylase n=1 Tax=Helicobacter cappadocius TaxID=3063998 RepID=A0AA90PT41_9HELI|nr:MULTISPECIES: peptidoglycan editing factor PgeF [unclassified Helicobacter]MDO7253047.1 peptidoglycan editing factor PgeF [Helicobacter sp. faydin-H75]MDP2538964.1 peptidoglycan editing factor PgeF [Helicobacter sp. faydin-H76]